MPHIMALQLVMQLLGGGELFRGALNEQLIGVAVEALLLFRALFQLCLLYTSRCV